MTEYPNQVSDMNQVNLLAWYKAVLSRIVDLVGDFAGDELFIIEGDSLLLHCFSSQKLDFAPGFQLLHATYLVEKFLQKLRQRKCVFEIIFFEANSQLCIPEFAKNEHHDRYLLARKAMIHHLLSIASHSESSLHARRFETFYCDSFKAHLAASGVYLLMCHDGALPTQLQEASSDDDDSSTDWWSDGSSESEEATFTSDNETPSSFGEIKSSVYLRQMIYWLFLQGYNVALINSVEFRDTKVMAMVIEGTLKRRKSTLISQPTAETYIHGPLPVRQHGGSNGKTEANGIVIPQDKSKSPVVDEIGKVLNKAVQEIPTLTQRQSIVIVTLVALLYEGPAISPETKVGIQSMILHVTLLQETQLTDRVFKCQHRASPTFFNEFLKLAKNILGSKQWDQTVTEHNLPCDLHDMIDGRMFFQVQSMIEELGIERVISPLTLAPFNELASLVDGFLGTNIKYRGIKKSQTGIMKSTRKELKLRQSAKENASQALSPVALLPFENKIFDYHLESVHIEVDETSDSESDDHIDEKFDEQTHWHSPKPLDQKKAPPTSTWEYRRLLRRNDHYMTEMSNYAKSLIGSTGISQAEAIVIGSSNGSDQPSAVANNRGHGSPNTHSGPKGRGKAPTTSQTVKEMAAGKIRQKAINAEAREIEKCKYQIKKFDQIDDPERRFKNADEYLSGLSRESCLAQEPHILAYLIETLLQIMGSQSQGGKEGVDMLIMTHIWERIARLVKVKNGVSTPIAQFIGEVCNWFGLPAVRFPTHGDQPLCFKPSPMPRPRMKIDVSAVEFQLLYGGPFMDRSMDSMPDPRTPDFEPDRWQRDVLDQIDAKKSVFIVAPTSAGKTFISFYAMRQVLKEDHDGILVYVAPNKALVNQIAAEVQARFRKSFPPLISNGKSVWAIHTRDHRVNNPMGCQILVTVPHILQIMLLSPSNANSWTPRLKRIIFDEVHCIGQAGDGVVWEQLLLLSPCPIIALSATVGNPHEFYNWLQHAQRNGEHDMKMIQYQHRYSDLRKYIYHPPKEFSFNGFPNPTGLLKLGLDGAENMSFMHPVLSLVDRTRGIPDDFILEPRDCLSLWKGMQNVQTNSFLLDSRLAPSVLFGNAVITKKDVIQWQIQLKATLNEWMKNRDSPFEKLLPYLTQGDSLSKTDDDVEDKSTPKSTELINTTLPLICSLHARRALPALFFNYDRLMCQDICEALLRQLEQAESKWKEQSSTWKAKIEKWDNWKKAQEATPRRGSKTKPKKTKNADDESISRAERTKDTASAERNELDSFDPERPLERFSLADHKKLSHLDFLKYVTELTHRHVPKWAIDALQRGIGVHHAGMNRKYRQICEILFRKGFLRVVIATGTLALGINMPCKTVVFSGDSLYLTALNFRQAAGRAGRRGFDVLGNVVFQHISTTKVHRLISSRLPDLHGHFPLTTTLVLRLFILLDGSKKAPSAVRSINSILANPRMCLGGTEMKETVLHFLRFSIEYLRRNNLLDKYGAPLNFAGCISHLYYTENSSFAFHALLRSDYLYEVCKELDRKPQDTLRTLMLLMSHLFGRYHLRRATLEAYQVADKRASSVVILPPLPKAAAKVLEAHDAEVLRIYTQYVSSYIDQNVIEEDCHLPFSGLKCGGNRPGNKLGLSQNFHLRTRITSPFYALSGHGDQWETISDLCESVRSGVWLEESVVPFVPVLGSEHPLNAYLYDFFKHGNVRQLETANGIRPSDVWYALNDFSMVLATLTTSLENFLNPRGAASADMLDIVGGGDLHELDEEYKFLVQKDNHSAKVAAAEEYQDPNEPTTHAGSINKVSQLRKSKIADSWEDEMDEDEEEATVAEKPAARGSTPGNGEKKTNVPQAEKTTDSKQSVIVILKAFKQLKNEFEEKFREMWA